MTLNELITKLEALRDAAPENGELRVCPDNGTAWAEDDLLDIGLVGVHLVDGSDGLSLEPVVIIQTKDAE